MINKTLIRTKITKAIEINPSTINLKREIREDDGMGGYIVTGTDDIATFSALLNRSGSSLSISFSDGGRLDKVSKISLLVPCSDDFQILKDDTFNLDGVDYKVAYPNKQLDIFYSAELEVV